MNAQATPQFAAPFTALNLGIGVLLSQYRMSIPDMQRPYAWKEFQARELVRDIEKLLYAKNAGFANPQHYFGSLVVLEKPGIPDEIVDGQQRLTTISVLLGVIQQALADLEQAIIGAGGPQAQVNAANCAMLRNTVHDKLRKPGPIVPGVANPQIPVLDVSPEVRDTYLALTDVDTKAPSAKPGSPADHLLAIANVFRDELVEKYYKKLVDNLAKLQHLEALNAVVQGGLVVVRLSTTSAGAAYELFESLNARGLDLNALDLIKVWMLGVLSNAGVTDPKTAHTMRELSSGDVKKQLRFFEDFFWARTGDKPHDGEKEYKTLSFEARRKLFGDTSIPNHTPKPGTLDGRVQAEVARMDVLTDVWLDLKGHTNADDRVPRILGQFPDRDWLKSRLDLLLGSTLGHKGAVYPLLMVAAEKMRGNPLDFVRLVHLLERFFFRFRIVCGGSETDIAKVYMKFIRALEANGTLNFPTAINDLQATMQKKTPQRGGSPIAKFDDAKFIELLNAKITYQSANRVKYFFNLIELYSLPTITGKTVNLKSWWVEHIFPQNPSTGAKLPDTDLHSMGNLCLLDPKMNKKLQNKDFDDKKKTVAFYKNQPKLADKIIIDDNDARAIFEGPATAWGMTEINARRQKLEKDALAIFSEQLKLSL
jgi:hypothetical protein